VAQRLILLELSLFGPFEGVHVLPQGEAIGKPRRHRSRRRGCRALVALLATGLGTRRPRPCTRRCR
jgi:hypothetical protein